MKILFKIFFLFLSISTFAQNQLWKGYFSYNQIHAIVPSSSKTYFATENALFVRNDATQETEVYNSINGFKAFEISALAHSSNFNKILVGNSNGQIAIVDEVSGKTTYLNDIVNKNTIPENIKGINDIYVKEGFAYLATKYGISVIRLNDNNFGDSYYIGDSGEFTSVIQITIVDNYIYALTEDFGIKRISLTNSNKIDFAQWEIYSHSKWLSIANLNGTLVAVKDDLSLNRFENNLPIAVGTVYGGFYKITAFNKELTVITNETVRLYNEHLAMQFEFIFNAETGRLNTALVKNGTFYLGTKTEGAMIIDRSNNTQEVISPSGPYSNKGYHMMQNNNDFYLIYGGMTSEYVTRNVTFGISKFNRNKGWSYLKPGKLSDVMSTTYVSVNPRKKGHLYVSSFSNGMLDVTLDANNFSESTSMLFDYSNSPLGSFYNGNREMTLVNGPNFDRLGTGWVTDSRNNTPLKSFDLNGNWKSYSFASLIPQQYDEKFGIPLIDKNNTKWITTNNNGIVGFNETRNNKILGINEGEGNGNLPGRHVLSLAIDNNNQLWIGTSDGIRVLSSVDQFINTNRLNTNPIIIIQDGVAEELLYQQQILKITVDGANNKWVSVGNGGVFLFSPNGQETLHRFDTQNSPLPSNDVSDILVDGITGEVFFLTDKGIVSFMNFTTESTEALSNVKVFPNPVRPDFTGEVKITGLISESNVKITDVAGNLVFEKKAEGGTVLWNTYNFSGSKVVSGVYMVFVSSPDGEESTVKKIMIVR